ncbi:MAG TPA: hypothetical protein PLI51_02985, partial [bacterium]|nr:hypothetical protein [bacterium]
AAVMKETGAPFPEAESLKRGVGLGAPEAGKVEAAVSACLARFEAEISRTLHTAGAATGGRPPDRLLLTGGGADLPGLRESLERLAGGASQPADPWTGVREGKHRLPGAGEAMGMASFAVGREGRRVNFRKEELTWAGSWGAVRRRLLITLGLILGLLAAFAVSLHLRMGAKETESAALQARISGILASAFPEQAQQARGRELQAMEDSLKEMRDNFDYYREFSSISGLDALLELSRVIPDKLKVQVVELDINQDRVRLRARTENYGTAELIKKAIQSSALFIGDQLKESPAKTRKDGAKTVTVEFTYTIPLIRQE